MEPVIRVEQLTKQYRIGQWLPTLREALTRRKREPSAPSHRAVDKVSFALRPGEALGIIGPNGAGKTTLLKLLAGVTQPTSGRITMRGRFAALIELGAGFHPELTGRENIFLNGAILGLSKADIQRRYAAIVDFAGVSAFLDTPVKRYSSGMYARLGFAIAAHVEPDVLLVDEVLAVGDYAFQQKCYAHMAQLQRQQGTALIFVSHNMEAVRRVCTQGLVMYRGQAVFQGSAGEAVIRYSDALRQAARQTQHPVPSEGGLAERVMTFDAEISRVTLCNQQGEPITVVHSGEQVRVVVEIHFHKAVIQPIFSFTIRTPDGRLVYDTTTRWRQMVIPNFAAGERCQVAYELHLPLLEGEFALGVDVIATDFSHYYDRLERALSFWVQSSTAAQGLVDLQATIAIQKVPSTEAQST